MIPPGTASSSVDPIISRLRPRSVVEILDQAFRLYRRHFLTFLAIIAVVHVPLMLAQQALVVGFIGDYAELIELSEGGTTTLPAERVNEMLVGIGVLYGVVLLLSIVYYLFQFLSQGALTAAVADSYLERPVSFGSAYRSMLRRLGSLLGLMAILFLIGIAIFLPVVLLIMLAFFVLLGSVAVDSTEGAAGAVGLICLAFALLLPLMALFAYVFVRLTVPVPAMMVEGLRAVPSLRRSWELVYNYWWRTFGLLVLLWVFSMIIALGPAGVVAALVELVTDMDLVTSQVLQGAIATITSLLYIPLQLVAITLYYFDLRVRKEGFDLEMAVSQRYGPVGAPTVPVGVYNPYAQPSVPGVAPPVLGGSPGGAQTIAMGQAPGAPMSQMYSPEGYATPLGEQAPYGAEQAAYREGEPVQSNGDDNEQTQITPDSQA